MLNCKLQTDESRDVAEVGIEKGRARQLVGIGGKTIKALQASHRTWREKIWRKMNFCGPEEQFGSFWVILVYFWGVFFVSL